MTALDELFAPVIGPVTWALLHFAWQGSAVALALSAVLALQRYESALTRFRSCTSPVGAGSTG